MVRVRQKEKMVREDKKEGKLKIYQRDVSKLPEGMHNIDKGVYLRVRGGSRAYFMRVQVDGVRHDVSLGTDPDVTIAEAKAKAIDYRKDIREGRYPWRKVHDTNILFEDFWEEACEAYAESRQWKRQSRILQYIKYRMRTYVLPVIGKIAVKDLTRDDILDVIHDMWMTRTPTADHIRYTLEKIMGIAVIRGIATQNPATMKGNLEFFLPPFKKIYKRTHRAAPSLERAQAVVKSFMDSPFMSHRAVLVLALTARRANEICLLKWDEVDLENGIFTIPDERMKVSRGTPRKVPIPHQLVEIMKGWRRLGPYVFGTDGTKGCRICAARVALKRFAGKDTTLHGFRSTFIDWAAENGVSIELAEKCIDHESQSQVRQAYQRSDLFEGRRELMQRYADVLFDEDEEDEGDEESPCEE